MIVDALLDAADVALEELLRRFLELIEALRNLFPGGADMLDHACQKFLVVLVSLLCSLFSRLVELAVRQLID